MNRDIIHAKRRLKRLRKSSKRTPNLTTRKNLEEYIGSMKANIKGAKDHHLSFTLPSFLIDAPQ